MTPAGRHRAEGPDDRGHDADVDEAAPFGAPEDEQQVPPGVETLQAAAREAINATRALLDVAEAFVNDPEMAERIGSVVRAATGAAARAARSAGAAGAASRHHDDSDDDGPDGVEHIPVTE
jgi:hypothetical protein